MDGLAKAASGAGRITSVVHTAGVSATTATVCRVINVDLVGTAHVIDIFEQVAVAGMSLACVASMAGHHARLRPEDERGLAMAPTAELAALPVVAALDDEPIPAYTMAKRANQLRFQASARAWNRLGARINTVGPGVISTAMARAEAASQTGSHMLEMLNARSIGRMGSTGELAEAVAYLAGPGAAYVTGTERLIDGGQVARLRWHAG